MKITGNIEKTIKQNFLLVYTRIKRESSKIISSQYETIDADKIYDEIKKLNNPIFNYINKRNIKKIGDNFNYHWQLKKKLSKKITDPKIDKLYDILTSKFNILGGKLIGAGGGGFFLVCVRNKKKLIGKLKKNRINYLEFQIEKNGSIIFDTN